MKSGILSKKITTFILTLMMSLIGQNWAIAAPPLQNVPDLQAQLDALIDRVEKLEADNQKLKQQLACVSAASGESDFYFDGCNVHVRNGAQTTSNINGSGNLIVGYNRPRPIDAENDKTGSHNLIIGDYHNYSSYGGFVAGVWNDITYKWASVSGGSENTANSYAASISGGYRNVADGTLSAIGGGYFNTASGNYSAVSGGLSNTAIGNYSSVSGGVLNTANGHSSSVSGGNTRSTNNEFEWVGGSLLEAN